MFFTEYCTFDANQMNNFFENEFKTELEVWHSFRGFETNNIL